MRQYPIKAAAPFIPKSYYERVVVFYKRGIYLSSFAYSCCCFVCMLGTPY